MYPLKPAVSCLQAKDHDQTEREDERDDFDYDLTTDRQTLLQNTLEVIVGEVNYIREGEGD